MFRQLRIQVLPMVILLVLCLPAGADSGEQRGKIREVNLQQGWVVIDSHRLKLTPNTAIRNLAIGAHDPHALQVGRPVFFTSNPQHELLTVRIYPDNPGRLRGLDEASVELLQ